MSYQAKNPRVDKRASTQWRKDNPDRLCIRTCVNAAERHGVHLCYAAASFHFKEPIANQKIGGCRSFMMKEVMPVV